MRRYGYSSLAALHHFPVDALKLDRSFVTAINGTTDAGGDVVVRSTVDLAHSLGLRVIAEGIETPKQLQRLRTLGCQYGQGFLFSEPLSAGCRRCQGDGRRVSCKTSFAANAGEAPAGLNGR